MSGRALSNKCFTMTKALNNLRKIQFLMAKTGLSQVKLIMHESSPFLYFPCYIRTVYNENLKLAQVVLHLILKNFKPLGKRSKTAIVLS